MPWMNHDTLLISPEGRHRIDGGDQSMSPLRALHLTCRHFFPGPRGLATASLRRWLHDFALPGRGLPDETQSCRPQFNIADNGSMIIDDRP